MINTIYIKQIYLQEIHNPVTWIVFLCTIILPVLFMFVVKKKHRKPILLTGAMAFSLYVIYAMTLLDRIDSGEPSLNLQLFWTWKKAIFEGSQYHWYLIIGNILLFIPFGVTFSLMLPKKTRKWWLVTLVGLLVSIVIEGAQYYLHLGLCELDDVFHNTLGMLAGYGLVTLMQKLFHYPKDL